MSIQPRIVAIGGGGGATQVLKAMEPISPNLTAIIAVTDTGRSTGLARQIGDIPAPGDLRATIAAFADDAQMAALLQQRFDGRGVAQLEGMAFGNLMLAAMAQVTGDFASAVAEVAARSRARIPIFPVTSTNTQLCAELADGTIVTGELQVRGHQKPPIKRVFLSSPAPAHPPALQAIREADMVVIGPGSLFTTVLAALLTDGLAEALRETTAQVVYIANNTTQTGQTDQLRMIDHIERVVDLLGPGTLNTALINQSPYDPVAMQPYEAEGLFLLQPDPSEIARVEALGVRAMVRELAEPIGQKRALWNKQDTVRHNPAAIRAALVELLG
ncbi:MAG: YvcK family protein [Roseiflexaceae bacterium]